MRILYQCDMFMALIHQPPRALYTTALKGGELGRTSKYGQGNVFRLCSLAEEFAFLKSRETSIGLGECWWASQEGRETSLIHGSIHLHFGGAL